MKPSLLERSKRPVQHVFALVSCMILTYMVYRSGDSNTTNNAVTSCFLVCDSLGFAVLMFPVVAAGQDDFLLDHKVFCLAMISSSGRLDSLHFYALDVQVEQPHVYRLVVVSILFCHEYQVIFSTG